MSILLPLAIAAFGIGTGLQAYGQYKQGQMAAKMYSYNRSLSLRYAKVVREMRAWEELIFWREVHKVGPRQKVITAAAGLEVSGTPLKVMKETRIRLMEQAKIMEVEREMEVSQIEAGAAISGMQGRLAAFAGKWGAFSTLLGGFGQLGMMAYRFGGKGTTPQPQISGQTVRRYTSSYGANFPSGYY